MTVVGDSRSQCSSPLAAPLNRAEPNALEAHHTRIAVYELYQPGRIVRSDLHYRATIVDLLDDLIARQRRILLRQLTAIMAGSSGGLEYCLVHYYLLD